MALRKRLSKNQAERLGVALDEMEDGSIGSGLEILRGILAEFFGVEQLKGRLLEIGWPIGLVDLVLKSGVQGYAEDEINALADVICALIELRNPLEFVPGKGGASPIRS